jgi:hypothetical protein
MVRCVSGGEPVPPSWTAGIWSSALLTVDVNRFNVWMIPSAVQTAHTVYSGPVVRHLRAPKRITSAVRTEKVPAVLRAPATYSKDVQATRNATRMNTVTWWQKYAFLNTGVTVNVP